MGALRKKRMQKMIKINIGDFDFGGRELKTLFFKCDNFLELTSYARVKGFENTVYAAKTKRRFNGKAFKKCINFDAISGEEQKELEKMLKKEIEKVETESENSRFDVFGEELDIGRYMGGEPECFRQLISDVQDSKKILIKVNMSINCGKKVESITKRAIYIMALYELFRLKNIFVDIEFCFNGEYYYQYQTDKYQAFSITVGPMSDPPKKIIFNALTGDFYRRVFHSLYMYFSFDKYYANATCEEVFSTEEERKKYDNIVVFCGGFSDYSLERKYAEIIESGVMEKEVIVG